MMTAMTMTMTMMRTMAEGIVVNDASLPNHQPRIPHLLDTNHSSETKSHKSNSTNVKIIVHTIHSDAVL